MRAAEGQVQGTEAKNSAPRTQCVQTRRDSKPIGQSLQSPVPAAMTSRIPGKPLWVWEVTGSRPNYNLQTQHTAIREETFN